MRTTILATWALNFQLTGLWNINIVHIARRNSNKFHNYHFLAYYFIFFIRKYEWNIQTDDFHLF